MGKYQEPSYSVLHKDGAYEVRAYEPFVSVSTKDHTLRGSGFNRLFSFISGQNKAQVKMPMTIPVINDPTDETMEFVLPLSMRKAADAPQPLTDQETIKEYELSHAAVVRFSGRATQEKIQAQKTMLEQWIQAAGYKDRSAYIVARYNAPFTPTFLRRNEVIIQIEDINEK